MSAHKMARTSTLSAWDDWYKERNYHKLSYEETSLLGGPTSVEKVKQELSFVPTGIYCASIRLKFITILNNFICMNLLNIELGFFNQNTFYKADSCLYVLYFVINWYALCFTVIWSHARQYHNRFGPICFQEYWRKILSILVRFAMVL